MSGGLCEGSPTESAGYCSVSWVGGLLVGFLADLSIDKGGFVSDGPRKGSPTERSGYCPVSRVGDSPDEFLSDLPDEPVGR